MIKNTVHWTALVLGLACAGLLAGGCGDGGMTKEELDSLKNSPQMTEADRQRVAEGMKQGAEAKESSQAEWARQNPEEVARINAERAKMGRPPLAGTQ